MPAVAPAQPVERTPVGAPTTESEPRISTDGAPPVAEPAPPDTPGASFDRQDDGPDGAVAQHENGHREPRPQSFADDRPAVGAVSAGASTCTAPQLRRFIKSRAYVPMHELRRRFGINGGEDEVTGVELGGERIYVGLPDHEGRLLGELMRGGEVGFELSLDPRTPIVIGVYPMRPVPRP
jgi:hypothetical protein